MPSDSEIYLWAGAHRLPGQFAKTPSLKAYSPALRKYCQILSD